MLTVVPGLTSFDKPHLENAKVILQGDEPQRATMMAGSGQWPPKPLCPAGSGALTLPDAQVRWNGNPNFLAQAEVRGGRQSRLDREAQISVAPASLLPARTSCTPKSSKDQGTCGRATSNRDSMNSVASPFSR